MNSQGFSSCPLTGLAIQNPVTINSDDDDDNCDDEWTSLTSVRHRKNLVSGEAAAVILFRPGTSWRELIFDPALVSLFCKVLFIKE